MIGLEKKKPEMVRVFAPAQTVKKRIEFYVQGTKRSWNDDDEGIVLRMKGAVDLAELIAVQMDLPVGSLVAIDDSESSRILFMGIPGEVHYTLEQVNMNYVKVTLEYLSFVWAGEDVRSNSLRLSPDASIRRKSSK